MRQKLPLIFASILLLLILGWLSQSFRDMDKSVEARVDAPTRAMEPTSPVAVAHLPPRPLPSDLQPAPVKPDPTTPTIMTPKPLISIAGKQSLIAKDGTPLNIELSPGNPSSAVSLQMWTDDQAPNAQGQYNWHFRMTAAAGGVTERLDPSIYEAPTGGYAPVFDYAMDPNQVGDAWKYGVGKSFFVRLNDGTHGLLQVQLVAAGAHFVMVQSSLNPSPGSRNLQPPPSPVTMRK